MLDESIDETSPDFTFEGEAERPLEDSKFADLPLWFASLVAPQTWDEPEAGSEPEPITRLFWRPTVGCWPIGLRQAWGDRANALESAGLGWKEAELAAFEEIMNRLQARGR